MRNFINLVESTLAEAWKPGTWAPGHLPPVFYHCTPLYKYDRTAASKQGSFQAADGQAPQIKGHGIAPRQAASCPFPAVYLADKYEAAEAYAKMAHGEMDEKLEWVVLGINPAMLDEDKLRGDCDEEAFVFMKPIMDQGFTAEQVQAWEVPWWATLNVTHQCCYAGAIPDAAIEVVKVIRGTDDFRR